MLNGLGKPFRSIRDFWECVFSNKWGFGGHRYYGRERACRVRAIEGYPVAQLPSEVGNGAEAHAGRGCGSGRRMEIHRELKRLTNRLMLRLPYVSFLGQANFGRPSELPNVHTRYSVGFSRNRESAYLRDGSSTEGP